MGDMCLSLFIATSSGMDDTTCWSKGELIGVHSGDDCNFDHDSVCVSHVSFAHTRVYNKVVSKSALFQIFSDIYLANASMFVICY